jgi:hypothetical protein
VKSGWHLKEKGLSAVVLAVTLAKHFLEFRSSSQESYDCSFLYVELQLTKMQGLVETAKCSMTV